MPVAGSHTVKSVPQLYLVMHPHQCLEQTQTSAYRGQYELMKSILLSNTGNCRVMASCDYLNALCVSQPSSNPIFRGFGIRKINTIDQRPLKYIHLHGQPIRDVSFHPDAQDGILISASLDKTLRLTSLLTDQVVQTYQCPSPVWSCCWASPNPHRLFAGCSNGTVQVFDIRVTSGPLITLSIPDNFSPVIGLQYVPQSDSHTLCPGGGLLVGQLSKITFMSEEPDTTVSPNVPTVEAATEVVDNQSNISVTEGRVSPDLFRTNSNPPIPPVLQSTPTYSSYGLPLEGSLVSLSLVPDSRHFLASYRPSHRLPRVRHVLAELLREETPSSSEIPGDRLSYTCREVHNLWAGDRMKMLTRARLFKTSAADNTLLAVAGCENAGGVLVWRCDTGMRIQTIQPPDTTAENPLIDICPYSTTSPAIGFSDRPMLALLSERTLHLYRWITTDS
ncbi:WD domain, G-beta repeat protein [Opisthorchis viverrini]|uniref:RING-type E3 ubiquitin transferase n=1 Tax=Opisthorchis viverrini TaxID=6198 RepID=A0A1S8X6R8_OPIVI|nr:WD domain, G-beta repeat protein [Opisthorchis viverrini]